MSFTVSGNEHGFLRFAQQSGWRQALIFYEYNGSHEKEIRRERKNNEIIFKWYRESDNLMWTAFEKPLVKMEKVDF
jgi:hypothetical protein